MRKDNKSGREEITDISDAKQLKVIFLSRHA